MRAISTETGGLPQYDVVVVGAGPVGLFAASMCGMLSLRTLVMEALPEAGGQCSVLYPEKPVQAVPAFPRVRAHDLICALQEQAEGYGTEFAYGCPVHSVQTLAETGDARFSIGGAKPCTSSAIIIAGGAGAFTPNRPELDDLEQFEGKSIFYHVHTPSDFTGHNVVIAGGGDSAVDWAVELSQHASSVAVVHRRPQFRCTPANRQRLSELEEQGIVRVYTPYQMRKVEGKDGQLRHLIIQNTEGAELRLEASRLLVLFGLCSQLGAIANWGLELIGQKIRVAPHTQATSRSGIFAAGDIVHYPGRINLIASGFAEAIQAAYAARRWIHPEEKVQPNCLALAK